MKKATYESVDQYIATQPDPTKSILEQVRRAIRKAIPKAEECISYNMPTYKLNKKAVIYFAGWKNHYSIYPASSNIVDSLKLELVPYEIRNGTIKFPYSMPAPSRLIESIAKLRATEHSQQSSRTE